MIIIKTLCLLKCVDLNERYTLLQTNFSSWFYEQNKYVVLFLECLKKEQFNFQFFILWTRFDRIMISIVWLPKTDINLQVAHDHRVVGIEIQSKNNLPYNKWIVWSFGYVIATTTSTWPLHLLPFGIVISIRSNSLHIRTGWNLSGFRGDQPLPYRWVKVKIATLHRQ